MTLMCGDDVCPTGNHAEGAIYRVGGTPECDLKITGNYTRVFNIHQVDGMTGAESLPLLTEAIDQLGTEQDDNYWTPTPGNVGYTLSILAGWATEHPEGVWEDRP